MRQLLKSSAACAALILGLFYIGFLNYVEPTEAGISWNFADGTIALQRPGWHITPPWVLVADVDTRPMRVCITSATRAFNCRLVQFVPSEYESFIATEGWRYYWWANRLSFNFGYNDEYRGFRDIMRGYGYSVEPYPFIRILREYRKER